MNPVEITIGLILIAMVLATAAQRLRIPYPTLMVLGGLVLGFVPGLPHIQIPPDTAFLIFIPPLVYLVASRFGLRTLRRNIWPIFRLAVGLVLLSVVCVAATAHWGVAGMSWPAAFVLAAIVGPTDTVAVTAVTARLRIPKRVDAILEGESLFNDVVALVMYRQAVTAVVTGSFSWADTGRNLVWDAAGGIAVGLAVGAAATWARHRVQDVSINTGASFLTPFAAFLGAEAIDASGVLATVAAGLYVGHRLIATLSSGERVTTVAFWSGLRFILEGLAFVLIGFELRNVLSELPAGQTAAVLWNGLLVSGVTVLVRVVWMLFWTGQRQLRLRFSGEASRQAWGEGILIGWAGMRGVDSLAAALALPLVLADGTTPFPHRNLILLVSFSVILTSLIVQGLTLPWLIRRLDFPPELATRHEEMRARVAVAEAALRKLGALEEAAEVTDETALHFRTIYQHRIRHCRQRLDSEEQTPQAPDRSDFRRVTLELIRTERQAAVGLWADGTIGDDVRQRLEQSLDYEELKVASDLPTE